MSRELKFRIWSKILGRFLSPEEYVLGLDGTVYFCELIDNLVNLVPCQSTSVVIQQYTGLKDKDNKEIYEGDILEVCSWRPNARVEVRWQLAEASDDAGINMVGFRRFDECGEPKLIGNIFEV